MRCTINQNTFQVLKTWKVFAILLLLITQQVAAQLYDKTWVVGSYTGTITFQSNNVIDTASFNPPILCFYAVASISNKEGDFQFFTEGVNVYSADGTPMFNGQRLADNSVNNNYPFGLTDGQNVIILPKSGTQYYIIYQSQSDFAYASKPWYYTDRLYYSVVDMSLQGGKGEVTEKRVGINSGYFSDGHMTACQHANGRDWWLVQRHYNFNSYFIYLVTADSISLVREQIIGSISQEPDAVGQSAFSPDGTKYATITGKSPLIILDFDRCEGVFSNPVSVNIQIDTLIFFGTQIFGGGGNGLCFSPNSRFLYVNSLYVLRQYDLLSIPIDSSEQVVFFWSDTNEQLGQFDQMHLAPNGKLYIQPSTGFTSALHVINYPDSAGLSCGFVKWGLPIATNNANLIPNMVHFRMGPLAGSGCDTISAIRDDDVGREAREKQIRVYPNPARDVVDIDLMQYSQYHPQQQFYLYDVQGKLVKQVAVPYLSAQLKVGDLAAGVYHWRLSVGSENRGEGKLEVVK